VDELARLRRYGATARNTEDLYVAAVNAEHDAYLARVTRINCVLLLLDGPNAGVPAWVILRVIGQVVAEGYLANRLTMLAEDLRLRAGLRRV
jgi:hypothetical protein